MANGAKLALREPVRAMIVGFPGAGKTGAIAALANDGYKIRVIDFDGNYLPLLKFTKPEFLKNIDIVSFEDKLKQTARFIETDQANAFSDALKMMDHWTYKDDDGTVVDLGHSKDWGCDTVVVLDSLTMMGKASMRRAAKLNNKTVDSITDRVWGIAMAEQEAFIERLTSERNRHHVLVLAHLRMIGPKDIRKGDSQIAEKIKEEIADLIASRYFPSALGQQLPPLIGGHFPTLLVAEQQVKMNQVKRVISARSRPELDLKVPMTLEADLPIATGLSTIFKELAPPLGGCVVSSNGGAKIEGENV